MSRRRSTANQDFKHFSWQTRRGIRGEAIIEALLCDHALPHHVVGPKDVGIDFICEWVNGERPTGVLFAIQVKTFDEARVQPVFRGTDRLHNGLSRYDIRSRTLYIGARTLGYWAGLGIPVYLFAVGLRKGGRDATFNCYYKRFTPSLTTRTSAGPYYSGFFRANHGHVFFAFGRPGGPSTGFARDLFIDHVRWSYYKGSITYPDPRAMGLMYWEQPGLFVDLFPEYRDQLCRTYKQAKGLLEGLCGD